MHVLIHYCFLTLKALLGCFVKLFPGLKYVFSMNFDITRVISYVFSNTNQDRHKQVYFYRKGGILYSK